MTVSLDGFYKKKTTKGSSPFGEMVRKEISGYIRSWQFIILVILILLTFLGSMYVSLTNLTTAVAQSKNPDHLFFYLKLLTVTDGSLPPFHVFINFLGPLLGIALGFDAINAEQQNGTLIRIMAQPVYRDNILLSKFISALLLVSVLFLSLAMLMVGSGMLLTGVSIEPQEVIRILGYIFICICYVGFWLSLAVLFSVRFKQAATSALTTIGVWLFFTVFYQILVSIAVKAFMPDSRTLSPGAAMHYNSIILSLLRLSPSQLYMDATTTLLMPSVRSLSPLSMEQMAGAIPSSLPVGESLMIVWPQLSGLIAATVVSFALSYFFFMRKEIKG